MSRRQLRPLCSCQRGPVPLEATPQRVPTGRARAPTTRRQRMSESVTEICGIKERPRAGPREVLKCFGHRGDRAAIGFGASPRVLEQ